MKYIIILIVLTVFPIGEKKGDRMKYKVIVTLLFFLLSSCSSSGRSVFKEEPTEIPPPTSTVTPMPTSTPLPTPTITPTPKKAEDFEGCSTMELGTSVRVNNLSSIDPELEADDVIHSNSSWTINGGGVRAEITSLETVNGITHFSVNGSSMSTSEGSIVYINIYTDHLDVYILAYSPTSNQFLVFYTPPLPPYPSLNVNPDSTVTLRRNENGGSYYQGNWCTIQEGESSFLFEGNGDEDPVPTGKCVTYKLPNGDNEYDGDEYGWGLNKYGETVCPQLWMEETETE